MDDEELREELKSIDVSEFVTVSSWEADFIESVVYEYEGPLSDEQRDKAEEIIEKYTA